MAAQPFHRRRGMSLGGRGQSVPPSPMKGRAMTNLGAAQRALPALLTTAGWVVAGSAILAASAQIALPIPLSPVPVTLQTFGLAVVVALLGTRLGTYATIAYLA